MNTSPLESSSDLQYTSNISTLIYVTLYRAPQIDYICLVYINIHDLLSCSDSNVHLIYAPPDIHHLQRAPQVFNIHVTYLP